MSERDDIAAVLNHMLESAKTNPRMARGLRDLIKDAIAKQEPGSEGQLHLLETLNVLDNYIACEGEGYAKERVVKSSKSEAADLLPIGTRIQFTRTLDAPANEDHPAIQYAAKGEYGTVIGYGTLEGYWVKADSWPHPFGASRDEFQVAPTPSWSEEMA